MTKITSLQSRVCLCTREKKKKNKGWSKEIERNSGMKEGRHDGWMKGKKVGRK